MDFYGLQETKPNQAHLGGNQVIDDIVNGLNAKSGAPGRYKYITVDDPNPKDPRFANDHEVSIIYDSSKYQLVGKPQQLEITGDQWDNPRYVIAGTFAPIVNGKVDPNPHHRIVMADTHAKQSGMTQADMQKAARFVESVREAATGLPTPGSSPVFFSGDFNKYMGDQPDMVGNKMYDSRKHATKIQDGAEMIDDVYAGGIDWSKTSYDGYSGYFGSDHRPFTIDAHYTEPA